MNLADEWTFENASTERVNEVPVKSISFALKKVFELAENEMGESIEFTHRSRGLIGCIVGNGHSTLSFDRTYDQKNHSLRGSRNARRYPAIIDEDFYFVDSNGAVSSVDRVAVLPLADVIRGLVYIFEYHKLPPFLTWTPERHF